MNDLSHIKGLGQLLQASARRVGIGGQGSPAETAPILKTELSPNRVTASPEMMEYGKQLAKEFWEAKDRMAHRQSRIDRLKNDLQTEYQRDKDDERNGDWTR